MENHRKRLSLICGCGARPRDKRVQLWTRPTVDASWRTMSSALDSPFMGFQGGNAKSLSFLPTITSPQSPHTLSKFYLPGRRPQTRGGARPRQWNALPSVSVPVGIISHKLVRIYAHILTLLGAILTPFLPRHTNASTSSPTLKRTNLSPDRNFRRVRRTSQQSRSQRSGSMDLAVQNGKPPPLPLRLSFPRPHLQPPSCVLLDARHSYNPYTIKMLEPSFRFRLSSIDHKTGLDRCLFP